MRDGPLRIALKTLDRLRHTLDLGLTRWWLRRRGEPRYRLTGACTRCGRCCETPAIQLHPWLFRLRTVRAWVRFWQHRVHGFEPLSEDPATRTLLFRCTHYDAATRSCDSYRHRPVPCRDYPRPLLYAPTPDFFDECGYRPVLRGAASFRASLEAADLTDEQRAALQRKLWIDEERPPEVED